MVVLPPLLEAVVEHSTFTMHVDVMISHTEISYASTMASGGLNLFEHALIPFLKRT
jgi:hypothetical protein